MAKQDLTMAQRLFRRRMLLSAEMLRFYTHEKFRDWLNERLPPESRISKHSLIMFENGGRVPGPQTAVALDRVLEQ